MTKREMKAVFKIGVGGAQIASGVLTGLGKGILGTYCRNHNLTQLGMRLAKQSIEGGTRRIREGVKEFKE